MSVEKLRARAILINGVMLLLLQAGMQAQTPPVMPRLTGIVNLSDTKLAVLETPPASPSRRGEFFILSEGQREGQIEVVEILPKTGTVKVNRFPDRRISALTLTNHVADGIAGLVFESASFDQVLTLYAQFSERTLLRSPNLAKPSFTMATSAENRATASLALQNALNEKGVATIPDGEKFMMIMPRDQAAAVNPRSSQIKPSGKIQSEALPAGAINFAGTDINQVVQIYAELVGRKLDRNVPMPPMTSYTIQFRNQTSLNRAEVVYALDTVLGWAGLKLVQVGDNQMKPVPVPEANR